MKKFLTRYTDIIRRYKNGDFGENQLTLYDILSKAGEEDILDKMSLSEIHALSSNSFGMLKQMFTDLEIKKKLSIEKMRDLEGELDTLGIKDYSNSESITDKELAHKFNLEVIYCTPEEMQEDVEAMLYPPQSPKYLGTIRVLSNTDITKFSYVHEIIHYLRDVGEGQRVSTTYTRKKQGKTDSDDEQDVNYLTAATIMPFEQISELLDDYEEMDYGDEKKMISLTAQKYEQNEDAVLRRIIEVRDLTDYNRNLVCCN